MKPVDLRNYIRLGHYEGLDFSAAGSGGAAAGTEGEQRANTNTSSPGDRPTIESIGQLRRKLRESMRLNALLHAEQERNAKLLADLRGLVGVDAAGLHKVKHEETGTTAGTTPAIGAGVEAGQQQGPQDRPTGPLAFLHQRVTQLKDAGADTPLSTTTKFTLSQMQALRALSTSLRTISPHLAQAGDKEEEDDNEAESGGTSRSGSAKSWRRERLEYVEGATRRHLETVQGLELGKDGEVRDGEWQGEGRRLARGEVEGLENVVSLLGGGESGSASGPRDGDGDDMMDES